MDQKTTEWAKRHGKVILLHDNVLSHTSKLAKDIFKIAWMGHSSTPAAIL
jgi:hypothetical protein